MFAAPSFPSDSLSLSTSLYRMFCGKRTKFMRIHTQTHANKNTFLFAFYEDDKAKKIHANELKRMKVKMIQVLCTFFRI